MAKRKTTTDLDAYHLARLAAWSGDFQFCLQQCKDVDAGGAAKMPQKHKRRGGFPLYDDHNAMITHAMHLMKNAIESADKMAAGVVETNGVDLALVETKQLRGIIYTLEPVVFELRAYACRGTRDQRRRTMKTVRGNLASDEDKVAKQAESIPSKQGNEEWVYRTDPYIRVELTGLGQVRAIAFWCRPPNSDDVRNTFTALLEDIQSP